MNAESKHQSFKKLVGIWQILLVIVVAGGAGYLAYSQYDKIPNQFETSATIEVVTKAKTTANS